MYTHYLILSFGVNTARRIGDILSLTWEHVYDPKTGVIRTHVKEFTEEKTDKLANPKINATLAHIISEYVEKTGVDVTLDDYKRPIFIQESGTYAGRLITESGHLKALKKAAEACGITYNVGTHSARKTFGYITKMIHPNDPNAMQLLQAIFNHSDMRITNAYIGLTGEMKDQYHDDIGDIFQDCVLDGKAFAPDGSIVLHLGVEDVRNAIKQAFKAGKCADALDEADMDKVDAIMQMLYQCKK
jgi:integrase